MISECKCGEVIGEDVAIGPKCGAPNEGHKQGWPWYGPALVLAGIGLAARQRSGPTRE